MARTTLRELNGFDNTPATLKDATVVLVDYQNTYTTGVMELEGWESALEAAADLLARARDAGSTVIHIVNDGGEGSPYDITAEIGQIHPRVAPAAGEAVVVKGAPNAYVGTNLGELVEAAGNDDVVIAGFMTNMCVQFTAEGTFLAGKKPTVVADASATRPLETAVARVSAEQLHNSALATIGDLYGVVVRTAAELH
ncbi:isochorismatase family protein [Amycolatopsis albispora]|uniref:Isochorismatase n=1 Tax=Amycolatopsis albispora TaxID=1804986 RepID=A0A344L052_9PSEU|nr:isochorismatase family protein [Amycolatopsis albispora]AXB41426.1 isochorismatase [Amycolatopsis albispora]